MSKDGKVYLINMKNYGYYLDIPCEGDFVFERYRLDQLLKTRPSMEQIKDFFVSQGITHLLMNWQHITSPEWGIEEPGKSLFLQFLKEKTEKVFEIKSYVLVQLT